MTTIALLEDEADLREEVADFLESCGHRVLQAGSLAEFPPLLSQARIVILDVMLPDGSGFDAARLVRAASRRTGASPSSIRCTRRESTSPRRSRRRRR
jgi:DNA-binding response OmpR family regulator